MGATMTDAEMLTRAVRAAPADAALSALGRAALQLAAGATS